MIIRITLFLLLVSFSAFAQDSAVVKKTVFRYNYVFIVEYKFKESRKKVKQADIVVYNEQQKGPRRIYAFKGLTTDNADTIISKILP